MYVKLSHRMVMTPACTVKYRFSNYLLLIHSELLNKHLCTHFAL